MGNIISYLKRLDNFVFFNIIIFRCRIFKLNMQIYKSQISVAIAFFIFISSSVACQYIFKGNAPYFAIPFLVCLFAIAFNGIYSLIVFTIITMTTDPDLTDYQKIDRELRLSKKFYARMYTIRNFLNFFF